MESDNNANRVLASVKEQELQFERLTRELEMERQIVATQLERCRLGSESPGAASASSSEKSLPWKSTGNSRSSTQMNSYSDSGYQDAVSYHDTQMQCKSELRVQHSFPGSVGSFRPSRAEGQAARQGPGVTAPSQLRRDGSMSIPYNFRVSTSRGSLRGTASYGYPILTEPSTFTSTSLSGVSQKNSPENRRTRSSLTHSHSVRTTSPGSPPLGSVGADGQQMFTLPPRAGMTAVPEHYESMKPRTFHPDGSEPYNIYNYENYGRIPTFTGVGALSSSPHGWSAAEPWSVTPSDGCVTLVYEGDTFQRPQYHEPHTGLYRSSFGVGNLQRSSSQCSSATYRKHYNSGTYWPAEPGYMPVVMDDEASVDSMQKNPREILWRDPELLEVIIMLQHQFPSVQANAAAYLQHLCYKDSRVKNEVFRLGGIKHLVELLDHKVLEVHRHACGALRNLVYGRATDNNKIAVEKEGGIPALLKLLRDTVDSEVRELVTGVLWNLSSCEHLKIPIIRDALGTLTNVVIVPHSGWDSGNFHHEHKLKFHSSLVLRNTTGCLRNLSSAGQEALKRMRRCEGLVDSLLHVITACDSTPEFDSKIVENCICTLRNLSYQLELEMPPSCLIPCVELEKLPDSESPSKKRKCCLWGKKKRKKSSSLKDHWDGVGPIPGFSESPRGAERLWHPSVVKPYLTLLAESSNPVTLEASAGSLQNLSAGKWKFSAYIRAAVRKEKGLPILVELLRMDNDRVVCSIATALRNMALDVRNKELIGKYAMKDLVNRLPGGYTTLLSDDTVAAVCRTLHEVTSRNMENAKALADTGGIEKLVHITKGRGESGSSMKVVKTAAQVLNTLWQYKDLRNLYKKDGWNQNHFLTPVSSLERQHFTSQPTLPSSSLQRPLQSFTPESATTRRPSQTPKTPSAAPYQTENSRNIKRTGSGTTSPFHSELYVLPARETSRQEVMYYSDKARHRSYDTDPRSALTRDYTPLHFSSEYGQTRGFRSPYGDIYPPSPDSWV